MENLFELYTRLYQLTEEQEEAISQEKYEELLVILSKREELIHSIDQIDVKEFIQSQNNPNAVDELRTLMEKIKNLEDKNMTLLEKSFGKLKGEMVQMNRAQKGFKGYNTSNVYEAKFIDKKR